MAIPGAPLPVIGLPTNQDTSDPSLPRAFIAPVGASPGDMIFADLQIEWRGMLFGSQTWMSWQSLSGWDTIPAVTNGSTPRIYEHGSFPGRMRIDDRTIAFSTYSSVGKPMFDKMWLEILKRVVPEDVERPLIIRMNGKTQMAWARLSAREADVDLNYYMGYPAYTFTWISSDPRRYSIDLNVDRTSPPMSSGGLDWNAEGSQENIDETFVADPADPGFYTGFIEDPQDPGFFVPTLSNGEISMEDPDDPGFFVPTPGSSGGSVVVSVSGGGLDWDSGLDWGTSSGGTMLAVNAGSFGTPLTLIFTGRLTAPFYLRSDSWSLGINLSLAPGEQLIVDTLNGTVTMNGVDRSDVLTDDSDLLEDCTLVPGSEELYFDTSDVDAVDSGNVTVQWRDADL